LSVSTIYLIIRTHNKSGTIPPHIRLFVKEPEPSVPAMHPLLGEYANKIDMVDDVAYDELKIDKLANDNNDKYWARVICISEELRSVPLNEIGQRLFEAYEDWAGDVCLDYQVKRLQHLAEVQQEGEAHAVEFAGGCPNMHMQVAVDQWVIWWFANVCHGVLEELEWDHDSKLETIRCWYRVIGTLTYLHACQM
jgi:hypothetical protein